MDKKTALNYLSDFREMMQEAEHFLWEHPQTGFREWDAHNYLKEIFTELGYSVTEAGNIPGFVAEYNTNNPGPCVVLFAELDSLICFEHPDSKKENGYVHACGHHAQCAALLGIAASLKKGLLSESNGENTIYAGKILLCCVPAEELIELEYRQTLYDKGIIKYFGGKAEFLSRGLLDEADIAIMVHSTGGKDNSFLMPKGCNGCIAKKTSFIGRAAHAGTGPQNGINALYAANVAISACNALRETFVDNEHIRFHPIITKGGSVVNAVPSEVVMESFVRGASMKAIVANNEKINRAMIGSSYAMGANVRLNDIPGYAPLINDNNLRRIAVNAMLEITEEELIDSSDVWRYGCTDMGVISMVMPAVHPSCSGCSGACHGADFHISNFDSAVINAALLQLLMLENLLKDNAAKAIYVKENATPEFSSKKAYLEYLDSLYLDKLALSYDDNGNVSLN